VSGGGGANPRGGKSHVYSGESSLLLGPTFRQKKPFPRPRKGKGGLTGGMKRETCADRNGGISSFWIGHMFRRKDELNTHPERREKLKEDSATLRGVRAVGNPQFPYGDQMPS